MTSSEIYHKLYKKMPYLRERVTQLAPLMDKLDPHEPVRLRLVIIIAYNNDNTTAVRRRPARL